MTDRSHRHTVVVSDLHVTEAEPLRTGDSLWKRYKHRDFFVDHAFKEFLEHCLKQVTPGSELVLNGDIFDFDAVMALPSDDSIPVNWLERIRGLNPEEAKSRFKIEKILADHPVWCLALTEWVRAGHRLVFVIGNHDIELHWPGVQAAIREGLNLSSSEPERVVFAEWFYVSEKDTLIEHGNQYDAYSLCYNPIHPTIRKGRAELMRLPFGNLANKYLLNGMGYFNPHMSSRYIMSFLDYMRFFIQYLVRSQPFLMWTWFWGASVTLFTSIFEGLLPANRDPLTVEDRVEAIADRAQASPKQVRQMYEIRAHPSSHEPVRILKELWLDRAFLILLGLLGSFYLFSFVNVFFRISLAWILIPLAFFTPFFLLYARGVRPKIPTSSQAPDEAIRMSTSIVGVKRVVHGHTHTELHSSVGEVEVLNTGSWSPSFYDVECTRPFGRRPFAWISPGQGETRIARLYEWKDASAVLIEKS